MCHDEPVEDAEKVPRDPETGGIILAHVAGNPEALAAALAEFADREGAQIAHDAVTLGNGTEVEISTVDLVWTGPGGAFETMIFVAEAGPRYCQRYISRAAAEQGHRQVMDLVRTGTLDAMLFTGPASP